MNYERFSSIMNKHIFKDDKKELLHKNNVSETFGAHFTPLSRF